jgi:hypothetical protein
MLGISLEIAATTTAILIAEPVETREIVLLCGPQKSWTVRFNPTTHVAYFDAACHGYGFRPTGRAPRVKRYIVFQTDPSETMRIDLEATVYKLTRERGRGECPSVTVGNCRKLP